MNTIFKITIILSILFTISSCNNSKAIETLNLSSCMYNEHWTWKDAFSFIAGVKGHIEYDIINNEKDIKTIVVKIETVNNNQTPTTIILPFLVNLNSGQVRPISNEFTCNGNEINPISLMAGNF